MPRRGRQASRDDTADIMHKFATALLSHNNGNNNGQGKSRGNSKSRGPSRGTSATPQSRGVSAQPRTPRSKSNGRGYVKPKNPAHARAGNPKTIDKHPKHQAAFALLQTPVPHLTAAKIAGARVCYSTYGVSGLGIFNRDYGHAFQASTTDHRAPQTIIARSMKSAETRERVPGSKEYLTYDKYQMGRPNDSFLLYVGGGNSTDMQDLWSAETKTAATAFKHANTTYNMYYSFAFMSSVQKEHDTTKHDTPIFCTMLIPCKLHNIEAGLFNLILPDSIGFVEPDEFPKPPDDLTYTSFFDTYRAYILATNFTRDCKLTDANWAEIKARLKSIDGPFDVTRVTNSFGPIQVVQSGKLKIGNRVGVTAEKGTLNLQMVFPTYGMQSGTSPGNSINLMHACFHNIMVKIKAKLDDDKYQKVMGAAGGAWTKTRVQALMLGLLDTYNTFLFNIGMSLPVTAERADFMANGMVSWKQAFITTGFIPKQDKWDAVVRTAEDPMAPITAQVDDVSSDDDADDAERPSVARGRSMRFLSGDEAEKERIRVEDHESKTAAKTAAFSHPITDPRHPYHKDYVPLDAPAPRDW